MFILAEGLAGGETGEEGLPRAVGHVVAEELHGAVKRLHDTRPGELCVDGLLQFLDSVASHDLFMGWCLVY